MTKLRIIKILYVDDDESNLFLFKINFESKYTVYTASSGWEGLEVLKAHHDDIIVVISDMKMPRMNGVEFIKKAKELYSNLIYFVLSAFEYNKEIVEAVDAGIVDRFFTKPFDMERIEAVILELLKKRM